MAIHISRSPGETAALGRQLAASLTGGQVIAFTGGMGAGKTTFCRGIAQGLGSTDPVQSPTFSLVNLYRGPRPFAHFDAWRITSPEDLETAGFYDYLESGAVIAVEWSENVAPWLEGPRIEVDIAVTGEEERTITITGAPPL